MTTIRQRLGRMFLASITIATSALPPNSFPVKSALLPPINGEQGNTKKLLERLGYPPDTKLLIIHADDIGEWHAVNAATIKALEMGVVNSGSIMVPCPWFPEIAAYARTHPEIDFGLHLTLTSERTSYRWGPVLSKDRVPSLLDGEGYLYKSPLDAAARINPREAEAEIRAQIERALAFGIKPTHLDSHQGTLFLNKPLFEVLLRVGHEYKIPVFTAREGFEWEEAVRSSLGPNDIVLDRMITIPPKIAADRWADFYADAIKSIRPGVTELVVHLAYADEEMRAATSDRPTWGAQWRQRDFDFVTSPTFRKLLEENNIKLITWRELGKLWPQS